MYMEVVIGFAVAGSNAESSRRESNGPFEALVGLKVNVILKRVRYIQN